ncbi:MAG TPA: hypothetical protein VGE52_01975, partial [Pirellulales bacterium]
DLNDSSDYSPASPTILGISPLESGSADQVLVDAMDVIDSDIRMNAGGGSRPEESDVRLVPDQASVDSDIRVSQLEDAAESGGIWPTIAKSASESRAFGSEDATPTLPEASQDLSETTPGIAPPNPVPEESDLSINMESPDAGDELPTITFAPPSASALPPPSLPQNLISMAPSGEDTAELDANSFELEADPAESDVTAAPFYMDDDVTLAEHTPDKSPAPSSSGFPTASSDEADEELTIAEGIDMKPSPDKTSLSLNPGLVPGSSISAGSPEPDAPAPAAGDSDLMLGGGDDLLQLSGSDVTTESPAAGANTSMVNLDRDADEDFVLGGEGGSDITINPSASGIGIGGGMESGLGLAGSGVDLEAPLEIGPSQSGLTLGVEDEFVLGSAGGSGVDQDDESDSGSQVIALDAASEDISNYTANPTMLEGDAGFGGMPLGGAPMLGGDPYAADPYGAGGLPDPMMNPAGQVGLAAPGYGAAPGYAAGTPGLAPQTIIVPRVELEYSPLQIVSLVFVTLVMVIAFLMMFDLTVLNGAQWTGIQWTASIVKPVVDLVGY